jgi:hypothetical protein
MKRIALTGGIIAVFVLATALVLTSAIVVAQDPGGDSRERLIVQPDGGRGPGPGDRPGHGDGPPPGPPRYGVDLEAMERAYAEELRQAQEDIAGMRTRLDEIHTRLREIWGKRDQNLPAEEVEKLRQEFGQLLEESSKIELEIAERQVQLAQKGMDLALERLVQARVALQEARIKKMRREDWMSGEHGGRFRDFRDRRREGGPPPEGPGPHPEGPGPGPENENAHDEAPSGSSH